MATPSDTPLLVASNRLPLQPCLGPAPGGLVAALAGAGLTADWVGWPGATVAPGEQEPLRRRLAARRLHPVFLDAAEEAGHYARVCCEELWPLCHDLPADGPPDPPAWAVHAAVNDRFAAELARRALVGARVWIHDFQLLLAAAGLRRRRPDLAIGTFLHVPFPDPGRLAVHPGAAALLAGLLAADAAGFQTATCRDRFFAACALLGLPAHPAAFVAPVGIDTAGFRAALATPAAAAELARLAARHEGRTVILGVDRLDASKGIPAKLAAYEQLLAAHPARAHDTVLVQVLVPSRGATRAAAVERGRIEAAVARIAARTPAARVELVERLLPRPELAALYRRADVLAVTSHRDGMNLVAQEFVLCHGVAPGLPGRAPGALVLSDQAGVGAHLPGALLVDPGDPAAIAAGLAQALALPAAERARRHATMLRHPFVHDARTWAAACLDRLPAKGAHRAA